jgi:glutamyl-tRNA reductase
MSNWRLFICGTNHKRSSLAEREPLQLAAAELAKADSFFAEMHNIMETTIVSTCNRIEFYFVALENEDPFFIIQEFYKQYRNIDISPLRFHFYSKKDKHAADHLFRVAAGIESMVIGETQILGQLKEAYSSACAVKAAGKVIHRLFHQAFRVGKSVRAETEMGKGACSVSGAAVELLKEHTASLDSPKILFIGVNQTIALAANGLNKLPNRRFLFANRTEEKAIFLAKKYADASGHSLKELPALFSEADIVVACTSASQPIITQAIFEQSSYNRGEKALVILDLAIPRDVDIPKDYNPSIKVFDLEDVRRFVDTQRQKREAAIPEAESIIERKLAEYMYWFDQMRHEPVYNGLDDSFEKIRQQELSTLMEKLDPEIRNEIDVATRRLTTRLLHIKMRASAAFPPEK